MAAAAAGAGAAANTRDVFVRTWFMAKKDDDAVDHIRGAHQIKFAANPAHPAEQIAFSGTKPGSGILCAPKAKLFAINTTNLSCQLAHVTGQNSEQWCVIYPKYPLLRELCGALKNNFPLFSLAKLVVEVGPLIRYHTYVRYSILKLT
jgi:hypothetical protein